MKCPFCSHENTRVIDSRPAEDNNSIRRRRVCDECGKRFTTYEKIETIPLIIIKKDNNREAYDRAKIEAGVLRACHKRPVSAQQITTLVDEVENEIFNREEREIPSGTIGELVMNKLKDLDAVAYVRFASVYREFKDVNTFMDELKSVLHMLYSIMYPAGMQSQICRLISFFSCRMIFFSSLEI
jgi:transcriptional repressor NrdR